ncbi:MAG: radical SAM protein [Thermodesulfobacteriota bacterium]
MRKTSPDWSKRPGRLSPNIETPLDPGLETALAAASRESRARFGPTVEFFLPGMFLLDGQTGLYPAVSITGGRCDLGCEHCRGRLLEPMLPAVTPEALLETARDLERRGRLGMLVSGGSDPEGRLPWEEFLPTLEQITRTTRLTVTVHAGYLDPPTARRLKQAGAAQALVDVIGDDRTARRVYHLERGTAPVWETLEALKAAGLEAVPHIVLGLDFGRIKGEYKALERLTVFEPARLVTVILSPLGRTPMKGLAPPPPEEAARFLAAAREALPEARHHLGCARPRGPYRRRLDRLAIKAGVNALALPSDEAWAEAEYLGLGVVFHKTCCSLAGLDATKGV